MTPPAAENKPASLGAILHGKRVEDRALLLTRRGLSVPPGFEKTLAERLGELERESGGPVVLTVLSNADPDLNPFAGLEPTGAGDLPAGVATNLVALLGAGRVHEWNRWPGHVVYLSGAALDLLARPDVTGHNAFARLQAAGGRVLLCDTLFLHDPQRSLYDCASLEPHERRRPAAWSGLTERLDDWLRAMSSGEPPDELARYAGASVPVTLHVTHSWGGGVAQWIETFIEGDADGVNLQLRAEGPQTGQGCGQCYALYLGNRLDAPIARWWLQPPILSTEAHNAAYREILHEVLERHGVGRVIVSSLVGHALDALDTGRPTVQVLHDYYPAWPLLGVHPGPFLRDGAPVDLDAALATHDLLSALANLDAGSWRSLAAEWHQTVSRSGVRLAAPSRSVIELLARIDPAWSDRTIEVIPHGLPDLPGDEAVAPREREDGRLRLVIPGRIHDGKGRQLLLEALPGLTPYAHVYLVGADQYGEAFYGKAGVDVVLQFERGGLRSLLAQIGPHVAGLLSVVPETFSFTLTEMQQLGIPVIATRVGSLEERMADGEAGWLIEPNAAALVERVRALYENRAALDQVRRKLEGAHLPGVGEMVERYRALCPAAPAGRRLDVPATLPDAQTAAESARVLQRDRDGRALHERIDMLQAEVEQRTRWAQAEQAHRLQVVENLESQLSARTAELYKTRGDYQRQEEAYGETVRRLNGMLENLQAEHDQVLSSVSWRLTRPLRFGRRVLANLNQAQAWNPARWPLLFSQAGRTIRTRGLKGALLRAQMDRSHALPPVDSAPTVDEIGDASPPAALPRPDAPTASIVIPVYNKWEYTAACLRSLAETPVRASFEVIVVDDGSSDGSFERLQAIEGITALRNEENLGFIGSCNRGAEQARGDFIVMLNNDTQVLDGWLDALLDTFEQFPDTGLAGARLVYPDGRLQEAGGMIFNDASGWNYGRLDDASRPEYGFTREADYCSGACIALPAGLWRELGGFDPLYTPAYYEDTDLAFRVRRRGLKVRVQAAANIVHHEGVTSGTDITAGTKRYQAVNREKFLERWRDELAHQPAPVVDPQDRAEIRRARDHRLEGRVLVVDAYTPEPDQDSGSLRLVHLMKCLRDLGYGVTFLPDNRAFAGRYTAELQHAGIEVVHDPWIGSLQKFFADRGTEFDFVMVSRHYVASKYLGLVRRHCPQARFLFDTVDLHYLREERQAELEDSLWLKRITAQTRRSELALVNDADATLVVSPVEKTVLAEAAPGARVHVVSNVHEVVGSRKPWGERKDLFFVGGYQHPPNIDGAQWFVGSIWPLIRDRLPGVTFHLIGSKAPDSVRALHGNGVHFHGFVEHMEPWLDGCRLAVAPLRYGAGIKGKVNQSMAHGQPVVATPMAIEGMFAEPGRDVLVAETPEDFADAVVRLYQDEDLWNRVSAAGQENVNRYFSTETARLGLQELLASL